MAAHCGGPKHDVDAELVQVQDKLASLRTVDAVLAEGDRQLLSLDASPERAQAVIVSGDVTTTGHVAVFTPGFTSTVQDSMAGYDREMDNLRGGKAEDKMHGATELHTGAATLPDGTALAASSGHSEYLKDQSTSQYNLAAIVAGHPEDAIPDK